MLIIYTGKVPSYKKMSFNGGSWGIELVFFSSVAVKEPIKPVKPCMFSIESMTWNETRCSTNTRNVVDWGSLPYQQSIFKKDIEMGEMARRSAHPLVRNCGKGGNFGAWQQTRGRFLTFIIIIFNAHRGRCWKCLHISNLLEKTHNFHFLGLLLIFHNSS